MKPKKAIAETMEDDAAAARVFLDNAYGKPFCVMCGADAHEDTDGWSCGKNCSLQVDRGPVRPGALVVGVGCIPERANPAAVAKRVFAWTAGKAGAVSGVLAAKTEQG